MGALPWFSRVLSCLPFRGRRLARDLFLDVLMLSSHCVKKKKRQDKTRQDKTRQDKTRQDKTRQDKTRQDMRHET